MRALFLILASMVQSLFVCFGEVTDGEPQGLQTFKGPYPIGRCKGESQYTYFVKDDGTYVYDGDFVYLGELVEYDTYYDFAWELDIAEKPTHSENIRVYKIGGQPDNKPIMLKIQGNFVNGMREGLWLFTCYEYNTMVNGYVTCHTFRINYLHGAMHGECAYIYADLSGNRRKTVVAQFDNNRVCHCEHTFYSNTTSRTMISDYKLEGDKSVPVGVWKQETDQGVIFHDFNTHTSELLLKATGQKVAYMGGYLSSVPQIFVHHFIPCLFDFCIGETDNINRFSDEEYKQLKQ